MSIFRTNVTRPFLALLAFLHRENLFRLMGVIVALVVAGAVGLTYFEENRPLPDALWWSIVTVTTVGFGDISPLTLGGRLIGVVLMFFGIGVLGMFTATIAGHGGCRDATASGPNACCRGRSGSCCMRPNST